MTIPSDPDCGCFWCNPPQVLRRYTLMDSDEIVLATVSGESGYHRLRILEHSEWLLIVRDAVSHGRALEAALEAAA